MPSDTAQNPKVYTVPEKNQGRKGSTFTDLLSRNKRGSTVQEVPRSASSFRKPSIIMEEVGCEKHLDLVLPWSSLSWRIYWNFMFLFYSQMIWLKWPSLPPCRLWVRTTTAWTAKAPRWTVHWRHSKNSTSSWDTPSSDVTSGNRSSIWKSVTSRYLFSFSAKTTFCLLSVQRRDLLSDMQAASGQQQS